MRGQLQVMNGELDTAERRELAQRVKLLETLNKKGRMFLPVVEKSLSGPLG